MNVLFVCTGNIFRSATAELALRAHIARDRHHRIASAGTDARGRIMSPYVRACLEAYGLDPRSHRARQITHEMVAAADIAIAMGIDHQHYIDERFGVHAPLFNELCYRRAEPLLDLHEALPQYERNPHDAMAYVRGTIRYIWNAVPQLLAELDRLAAANPDPHA